MMNDKMCNNACWQSTRNKKQQGKIVEVAFVVCVLLERNYGKEESASEYNSKDHGRQLSNERKRVGTVVHLHRDEKSIS